MSDFTIWAGLSLLTSFIFILWWIPRKYAPKANIWRYNIFYALWIIITWVIFNILTEYQIDINNDVIKQIGISIIMWLSFWTWVWIFTKSIDLLWLAVANAFKNAQPIFSFFLGWLILWEIWNSNIYYVFIWSVLIALLWFILSKSTFEEYSKNIKYIYLPLIAWLFFAFWNMLIKIVSDLWIWSIMIFSWIWSLAYFYLMIFLSKAKQLTRWETWMWLLSWLSVGLNFLGVYYSFKYLEYSIAYPIINLNTLWVIIVSIVFFHELNWKEYRWKILLSMVLSIIAIFMFYLAKT